MNCPPLTDMIGWIGALAGVFGTVAAIAAVAVSVFQVRRDASRERHQAEARARTAKLLIGAAYASSSIAVRELERTLRSRTTPAPAINQAAMIRDNQQLAIIFQALLTIDATALPAEALKPVGDAQSAFVAMRNLVESVAAGRSGDSAAATRLEELMQALKNAFEQMRGFVPFEIG